MLKDYEFELDKICDEIKSNGYSTVGIQMPDGIKSSFDEIAEYIESETDALAIVSAEPCFGGCDIHEDKFKCLGVEFIIHFGHSEIPSVRSEIPTMFIELHLSLSIDDVTESALRFLKKRVGLVTTVQHIHSLENVRKILEKKGFRAYIGKGDKRIKYKGQVLGCNFSSARNIADKVENFLYIGSGNFHPLGVELATNKKTIIADPYSREVRDVAELKERILRQRHGAIVNARDARRFGILVGTKVGQVRMELAKKLKRSIEAKERKAYILSMNHFSPEHLSAMNVDVFVSTSCPRIAIDDYLRYEKSILTPVELEIALGERKWEDYKLDEID